MKAIRRLSVLMLLFAFALETKANPVDVSTARDVAVKFMNANAKTPVRGIDDLHLVTTYNINRGDAAFYIFNTSNGFVIVSADDCATPILGYSDEGQFDIENIPIQLQDYLQGFAEQIQYGIENYLEADEQTSQQWELVRTVGRLTNNRSDEVVEPLLTTIWNQDYPYNMYIPSGYPTGCTATAMAQIMKYWEWPVQGTGQHSYEWNGQILSANFGETIYDWDNMIDDYYDQSTQEQREAVATLMWHCGVSVNMNYASDGSGALLYPEPLINYFGYSNEMSAECRWEFSDAVWKAKLKDCLNLNRPIYYTGYQGMLGHAFVCDGYDINEMFHFNWGWGGVGDGYFAIGALILQFDSSNRAIFNIHPQGETTNYEINVTVNPIDGGAVSGSGSYAHGTNVTLTATANEGYRFCYWEENGGIVSTNPLYSFTTNYNRDLVAVFAEPFAITTSTTEGGSVSGDGFYYYGEMCILSATPNDGFCFAYWSENGNVVSHDPNYSFVVTSERFLTAHFASDENVIWFYDLNVKAICVANWDSNGDGVLSYNEASAVTSIGEVFRGNTEIYSFDELYYFDNLTSIDDNAFNGCSGLSSLNIPNAVISIGNSAFYGCRNLSGLYIPNTITSIEDSTFYGCSRLTSLIIPNPVSSIGSSAFYGCSGLISLTIPNTVTSIGDYAFSGCSNLTSLIIPQSVTSIGSYAFYGCNGLTRLTISNSLISIGNSAFSGCSGLMGSLTIPNTVTSIDDSVFYNCNNLTSMVFFAETPPTIGANVFNDVNIPIYVVCESVEAYQSAEGWYAYPNIIGMCSLGTINIETDPTEGGIVIGTGTYESGTYCTVIATPDEGYGFAYWTEDGNVVSNDAVYSFVVTSDRLLIAHFELLEGNIEFVDAMVEEICVWNWDTNGDWKLSYEEAAAVTNLNGLFSNMLFITSFDELQYFTGLTSIEAYEFVSCFSLVSITLPNSVTSIGDYAFDRCESLQSLFIPASVTSIGQTIIGYANNMHQIVVHPNNTVYDSRDGCNAIVETSTNTLINGCMNSIIPNSVTSIGSSAFYGCSGIMGLLAIPNSVISIGEYAFNSCSGITSVDFGDSVISIGEYAFHSCRGITSVVFGNSVASIGNSAFEGCYGLNAVYYSGNISQWCNISFEDGFSNPLYYAHNLFINNTLLTELVIPENVTTINQYAFCNATCLTGSLTIPNSVTSIGSNAFSGCSGMTGNLVIPNSVTSISYYAFSGCSGFTESLTLGNSLTTIGSRAFYGCNGFTGNLIIPNSVTSIGYSAFYNCSNLESVIMLSPSVPSLGSIAFSGANANYFIYVPYSSLNDYKTATNWSNYESRIYGWLQKSNLGYGNNSDRWAFIASPLVGSMAPDEIDNMISETGTSYDLYRFNQSAELEWENQKAFDTEEDQFPLVNGLGYLYASGEDVNLFFKGQFNEDETKVVSLEYDVEKTNPGWNLVGNPFPVDAYLDRPYYVMNEEGTAINPIAVPASTPIPPCVGVLVKANGPGELVTFSRSVPEIQK